MLPALLWWLQPVTALSRSGRRKRMELARTVVGALLGIPVNLQLGLAPPPLWARTTTEVVAEPYQSCDV